MKKLKVALLAAVFAIGIGGSLAETIIAAPNYGDQIYSWTSTGFPPFTGTVAQAEANYGCHNTSSLICATGTAPGVPNVILYKSE
jgi:amino acid transporter